MRPSNLLRPRKPAPSRYNATIQALRIPKRIALLPISPKGMPVPWFAAWIDGVPDLRIADTPKIQIAIDRNKCWICGQPLGRNYAFVIGPMCSITRVISEPASHRDCAIFSARACPFLANPQTKRNEAGKEELGVIDAPGVMIKRNPGAVAVWVTRTYSTRNYDRQKGRGMLFDLGDPEEVIWFTEGREATRAEIEHSIETGLPLLDEEIRAGNCTREELDAMIVEAKAYLPPAEENENVAAP